MTKPLCFTPDDGTLETVLDLIESFESFRDEIADKSHYLAEAYDDGDISRAYIISTQLFEYLSPIVTDFQTALIKGSFIDNSSLSRIKDLVFRAYLYREFLYMEGFLYSGLVEFLGFLIKNINCELERLKLKAELLRLSKDEHCKCKEGVSRLLRHFDAISQLIGL